MIAEFRGYYPPKENITVWRYMDFTKFVDLISNRALFFVKSSNFEDPFEGIYPISLRGGVNPLHETSLKARDFNFINCWHINNQESAAMWKLYLSNKEGIAIKTTTDRLKNAFAECSEEIFISIVKYWDPENEDKETLYNDNKNEFGGSTINPLIFKRLSFKHENELRLIHNKFSYDSMDNPPKEFGLNIPANLEYLIDEIHIAPYASHSFTELVNDVCKKYEVNKRILKSNLYNAPWK
jgi:hypothetical protein